MATLDEVRRELDKDELDYPALASVYGADVLPQLKALVTEDEPRIASKAAYLAGAIAGGTSKEIVALAARSRHDVVRVAAAAVVAKLPATQAVDITMELLGDADQGVRVRAVKSASIIDDPILTARLKSMADHDPELYVRNLAGGVAARMRQR